MQSLYTVLRQQIASTEFSLKTESEYCSKDSQPTSRPKSHTQTKLAFAAAAAAYMWWRDLLKETWAGEAIWVKRRQTLSCSSSKSDSGGVAMFAAES